MSPAVTKPAEATPAGPPHPGASPAATPAPASPTLDTVDPAWAWARYEPSARRPWNLTLAAHLLRRTGYGAPWRELQQARARGPQAAIDELLTPPPTAAAFNAAFDDHEASAARSDDAPALNAWWLRRLIETPWPLLEKTTLFWHHYFAVGSAAVADLKLFHEHLKLLRNAAFGDFASRLNLLAQDAAMYAGLGGNQNRKSQPNLGYARPWLEAFSVGPKAARREDVENVARAWTGWFLYGGNLRFVAREHDEGDKTILGQTGPFGRDEAIGILASHPATALHVARKLFLQFVSEAVSPPDALLAPLAERIRGKASMSEVLGTVFRSNLFFSDHAVQQKIKSPVELAIGLARSLEGRPPTYAMAADLANLGQRLDQPPTVQGWPGGVHWINTISLGGRLQLCESMLRGAKGYGGGLDPGRLAREHERKTPGEAAQFWLDVLLQNQLPPAGLRRILDRAGAPGQAPDLRGLVLLIVSQPEYQLG